MHLFLSMYTILGHNKKLKTNQTRSIAKKQLFAFIQSEGQLKNVYLQVLAVCNERPEREHRAKNPPVWKFGRQGPCCRSRRNAQSEGRLLQLKMFSNKKKFRAGHVNLLMMSRRSEVKISSRSGWCVYKNYQWTTFKGPFK